jgi:16S rRNA (guanine527-N7)-methyltransferase
MVDGIESFSSIMLENNIEVDESKRVALKEYVNYLTEWNSNVNLISRKDLANIWSNHILHSASVLFSLTIPEGIRMVDVGTGGGLPGIPLSILLQSIRITLVDSIQKKSKAVADIVSRLGLKNVSVVNDRAESLGSQREFQSAFDIVIARAVAPLSELVSLSLPLCKKSSGLMSEVHHGLDSSAIKLPYLIAMKGGDVTNEIAEAKKRYPRLDVRQIDIKFKRMEETGLVGKKLIVVQLEST